MVRAKNVIFVVFFLWVATVVPHPLWAQQLGDRFPDLKATTLDGRPYPLSRLEGQPVLLKLGATWCPHCKELARRIEALKPWLGQNNIRYVEVFLKQKPEAVQKYLRENPELEADLMLTDDGTIGKALGVRSIPRLFFLDADFRVYRQTGSLGEDELQHRLQKMIDQ